jgi:hypothetical protein
MHIGEQHGKKENTRLRSRSYLEMEQREMS